MGRTHEGTASRLVLLLFFVSGGCGLVYQVVWTRLLMHTFGSTAVALGTVLAAFMSGLAAGSWLVGKIADRSENPLRLYALLEAGIALAALVAHVLLQQIVPLYLAGFRLLGESTALLASLRFVLAFALVMAPTILMGATLPVLTRYSVRRVADAGARLGGLYAANTLGAVAGTVVTGFFAIRALGIHAPVYLAVGGNLAVGAAAWLLSRRAAAPAPSGPAQEPKPALSAVPLSTYRLVLAGFALSGLASFAYEIYWTRSLVFLLGNSTYAVSAMLTAFLSGIALGGYLVRFVVDRTPHRVALFALLQISIGVVSAFALPLLFRLASPEAIRVAVGGAGHRFAALVAVRFGIALAVMLVPATLIGATFPLVGRIGLADPARSASAVGRIYAVNTLGNVAGALLPGLVLIAWLGIQKGILLMAILNVAVGGILLLVESRSTPRRVAVAVALAAIAMLFARVPVDFRFPAESQTRWERVLFYREGPTATSMVLLDPDTRKKSMSIDGIDIGGNHFTDFKQQLLAHLPKLLADDVSAELSIGLGSGILAGESARHSRVQRITCVEIEPSVVAGAALFAEENHGILQDPRLRVVVDDVANHLRTTGERYDVISADEKTAQEYASNGFSYSREYYSLLLARLEPNGLVAQWVPADLPPSQYAMVLRTFASVFPEVKLFSFEAAYQNGPSNTILVGAAHPIPLDTAAMSRRLENTPAAYAGLARYGLTSSEAVLAHFVAGGDAIRSAVAGSALNTLDYPRYEFYSPRDYAASTRERLRGNHELLAALRRTSAGALPAEPRLAEALAAERAYMKTIRSHLDGTPTGELLPAFERTLSQAPWNDSLRSRVALHYWNAASSLFARRELRGALGLMERAVALDGSNPAALTEHAIMLLGAGDTEGAIRQTRIALEREPQQVLARRVLADALLRAGRAAEAAGELRELLAVEPGDAAALELLGRMR